MGRPKGSGKNKGPKDPFESLPEEFKDKVVAASREEIEHEMVIVTMNNMDLKKAQEDDGDLAEKKEAAKQANEMYSEGFKANSLKLKFLRRVLNDKGGLTKNG